MQLTKKQFEEEIESDFNFDDIPFREQTSEEMFKLFNLLPRNLQGTAIQWGANDSVFRDDFFVFIIKNQFDMSIETYYESDIFKKAFNETPATFQEINWTKLEK